METSVQMTKKYISVIVYKLDLVSVGLLISLPANWT